MIGGLQGIVDHMMVGNYVGFNSNAAIGVGWQIFLVVVVFISSLFTGMGVLVARFAGANDHEKVNRVVYQAFLTAVILGLFVLAPIGHASVGYRSGVAMLTMAAGIFSSGLQLAAPVIGAAITVEVAIALISRLAPPLPAMVVGIPLKTLISYAVLTAGLAIWPHWIEGRFVVLLDAANRIVGQP